MGSDEAQDASTLENAPPRLTRRALFDLDLEQMRWRGELTDGMERHAPPS
jgi:hypothetical protein